MNNEDMENSIYNFEYYYNTIDENERKLFNKQEIGYVWLCDLLNVTFYDYSLEIKWGKLLYDTIIAILEDKQNIIMADKYEEYLLCLNLIGEDKFDWGTSIRYCWFDNEEIKNEFINYVKQIGYNTGDSNE